MKLCQSDQRLLNNQHPALGWHFWTCIGWMCNVCPNQKVPNVERVLSVHREPYFNLGQIWLKKVQGLDLELVCSNWQTNTIFSPIWPLHFPDHPTQPIPWETPFLCTSPFSFSYPRILTVKLARLLLYYTQPHLSIPDFWIWFYTFRNVST